MEGNVVTVASASGRSVWGSRCPLCDEPADSTRGQCPCDAEYLGDGWWWIPGRGEERVRGAEHQIDSAAAASRTAEAHRRGAGVDACPHHDVQVFSTVRVREAGSVEEYTLVRPVEADAAHGRISVESPVGRSLLGRRRGEEIEVQTPGGLRRMTVVEVSAPLPPVDEVSPRRSVR